MVASLWPRSACLGAIPPCVHSLGQLAGDARLKRDNTSCSASRASPRFYRAVASLHNLFLDPVLHALGL